MRMATMAVRGVTGTLHGTTDDLRVLALRLCNGDAAVRAIDGVLRYYAAEPADLDPLPASGLTADARREIGDLADVTITIGD